MEFVAASKRPSSFSPLAGRRVLDLSQQLPGGYAAHLLAQLGASVVKIEPPWGDALRELGPDVFALLGVSVDTERLDLTSPAGKRKLHLALVDADAVLVSGRAGALQRLGLDDDTLRSLKPGIVYCRITGYDDSPNKPAHDLDAMAASGLLSLLGPLGAPHGAPISDLATGALAALAIAAALATDKPSGAEIDLSLTGVARTWAALGAGIIQTDGDADAGQPPRGPEEWAGYGVFEGSDGGLFAVAAVEARFWRRLVDVAGIDDEFAGWDDDARRYRSRFANEALRTAFCVRPAASWLEDLVRAEVPSAPVRTAREAVAECLSRGAPGFMQDATGRVHLQFPGAVSSGREGAPEEENG